MTNFTPLLRNPLQMSRARHQRPHPFLSLSWRHLGRPGAPHPVHQVVVVFFLSATSLRAIASIIQTLVQIRGGRGGGGTPRPHLSPETNFLEQNRQKTKGTCYPRVKGRA